MPLATVRQVPDPAGSTDSHAASVASTADNRTHAAHRSEIGYVVGDAPGPAAVNHSTPR